MQLANSFPIPRHDLVGQRNTPWSLDVFGHTGGTPLEAAQAVVQRYDANRDGVVDIRTESTIQHVYETSMSEGPKPVPPSVTITETRSIDRLLEAAIAAHAGDELVDAKEIATVLAKFDTTRDGKLDWTDGDASGTPTYGYFEHIIDAVGEVTTAATMVVHLSD